MVPKTEKSHKLDMWDFVALLQAVQALITIWELVRHL